MIYDVTDENSFKNIRNWIKQIESHAKTDVCKVLVGNNCDNPNRKVTEENGKKLGDDFNIKFFEASPKTNKNVNEVFYYLVGEILKVQEGKNVHKNIKIKDKNTKTIENINKDIKYQKNSDEKEIDYNKNVSLKLYTFLNY